MNGQILVVDDEPGMCKFVDDWLSRQGYSVSWRTSAESALALMENTEFDVILADVQMAGMTGLDLCHRALAKQPEICFIVMTGFGKLEYAVGALRAGACDFITKPISSDTLTLSMERAMQQRNLGLQVKRLSDGAHAPESILLTGTSEPVLRLTSLIQRVAMSDATVLITGESGTGKELVARSLHEQSQCKGPFLAINCAAIPEHLLESELFGHVRGAFTDAKAAKIGLFVQANGGLILLDEIGEMPLGMQAKLLRALQERRARRVGSAEEVPFDARIVAATNRDLEAEVAAGRFREDLFYRVNVVRIEVPPLRARGSDVLLLAQRFLTRAAERNQRPAATLSKRVAERFLAYNWPGNVRELENCIECAVALAKYDALTVEDLPRKIRDCVSTGPLPVDETADQFLPLHLIEERHVLRVLSAVGGNKTRAAKLLGLDRRTLHRKLGRLD